MLRSTFALTSLLAVLAACGDKPAADGRPAPGSDEAIMQRGLDLMYQAGDPVGAEATFRELLTKNPTHYGAHYQLAVSLDRGGRPAEARPAWEKMRSLAEAAGDTTTLATVKKRLASPDTASQEAMMALGLDLMYRQNNATAAAQQFRRVLSKNPTHYGATYQLATALDRSGQLEQGRRYWQRMLGMATQINDEKVMAVARDRLK